MFVYYTNTVKLDVFDKLGRWVGRPYDFLVKIGPAYPQLSILVLVKGRFQKQFITIPWTNVKKIDGGIYLNIAMETFRKMPDYMEEGYTSIRKGILDQQVVDTFNKKVVRVNDLHLLRVEKDLRLSHVDVGFRGLVRRLGWERLVDLFLKLVRPHALYLTREVLIPWKFVQPLDVQPRKGTIQLNVSREDLSSIPPPDLSEIMEDLDPPERIALFRTLDFDTQVDVLNELEVDLQKDLIEELDKQTAIGLLEKMEPDEVADLLGMLSRREVNRILSMMSSVHSRKIYSLLKYESDSAGGLMTTEFVSFTEDMTVADAMEKIKRMEVDVEMIYYTYVLGKKGHLLGMVTFKQLLTAAPSDRIINVMVKKPISVSVTASFKEVAFLMDKYNFLAVPVVDSGKVMQGIITIDDALAMVIDETWGEKPGLL